MIKKDTEIETNNKLLRESLFAAHKGKCFYTNKIILFNDFHIDHIIPIKHGGNNIISNYVPCCKELNLKKNDKYDEILSKKMVFINELLYVNKVLKHINTNSIEKIKNKLHFNSDKNNLLEKCGYYDILVLLIKTRKDAKLTQQFMADWLKVDRRKIMAIEDGEINISLLLRYADKLSIDVKLTFELN